MFGHNFAGFAASHVTPDVVARGRALLKAYAGLLEKNRTALWLGRARASCDLGPRTSFGANSGSFPTFRALATLA
jgi:hypothetical protein